MSSSELNSILNQIRQLSSDDQLLLISEIAEMLREKRIPKEPRYLEYGKYHNEKGRMSTEEDFRIAEWHPTEKDLDGP